jgi:putative addiction module component (TIGR02574 family)
MSENTQQIIAAALQLPERDRAEVVERLMESFSPEFLKEFDELWDAEFERRMADPIEESIPWEQLKHED